MQLSTLRILILDKLLLRENRFGYLYVSEFLCKTTCTLLMEDDSIDEQLLEEILDILAHGHNNPDIKQPRREIITSVLTGKNKRFLILIGKMIRSTYWASPPPDLTDRMKLCLDCYENGCEHVENSSSEDSCDLHDISWMINGFCGMCVLEDRIHPSDSTNSVSVLWDSTDLADFCLWVESMILENGQFN